MPDGDDALTDASPPPRGGGEMVGGGGARSLFPSVPAGRPRGRDRRPRLSLYRAAGVPP